MNWRVEFLPEAQKDFEGLAGNQRLLVAKALKKVQQNPVSIYDGSMASRWATRAART